MQEISQKFLKDGLKKNKKDEKHTVLRHALTNIGLMDVITSHDKAELTDFKFSTDIKTMNVANQKSSGRCWIFAATNVLREIIAKKCNIAQFELSQSYIAFYDRLEKANYLMESIIELIDRDHDDRTLTYLLQNGVGDGGQWDMFVSIVEKYGLCPKAAFPETATSSGTMATNRLINFNIRKFASDAKSINEEKGIDAVIELKENVLKNIYNLLIDAYGVPPEKFDFEYIDKDNKYHVDENLDPHAFKEKYIGEEILDYVSLINAPTKEKPFGKTYTIQYLGNVVGGRKVIHLNVTMDRMKELILSQLNDGSIVWFGSDVGFYGDRNNGIWDDNTFDSMTPFGLDWKMEKGESLDFWASQMNHAMCITGVNIKNGVPERWKIENSWGSDHANAGYYVMSASWFDQFVYQAVVNRKYLNAEERKALEQDPIELKPWDPMGSLAD